MRRYGNTTGAIANPTGRPILSSAIRLKMTSCTLKTVVASRLRGQLIISVAPPSAGQVLVEARVVAHDFWPTPNLGIEWSYFNAMFGESDQLLRDLARVNRILD